MSAAVGSAQKAGIWLLLATVLVPSTLLLQGASGDLYLKIVDLGLIVPKRATEIVMLALIAAFGLATWGFRRLEARRILTALAAGIGIVIAYGLSEAIKVFYTQERPCRELVTLDNCPAVGDWAFPSNHSTIAFAVATGILIVTAHRWALLGYLGALVVGGLRIITGAHYPHDVLGGAILGICVTIAIYLLLAPLTRSLAQRPRHRAD